MKAKVSNVSPFILLLVPFLLIVAFFAGFSPKSSNEKMETVSTALPEWRIPGFFQVKVLFFR